MTSTVIRYEIVEGLPEDHGIYLFLLRDGSIKEGFYSSFPFPHHDKPVRYGNLKEEFLEYGEPTGWLRRLPEPT